MVEHARVLIIGGGAVGVSSLYHLAKLGWADCLLLEQNELTSGSTWHAAGNCPTYSTGWDSMKLQRYSAELYRQLGDEVDYPIELPRHRRRQARSYARAHGRVQAHPLHGALQRYGFRHSDALPRFRKDIRSSRSTISRARSGIRYDGDIDPAQLTQALAKGARDLGAKIRRFTKVTALAQLSDGRWRVTTNKGEEIIAENVVNAAGYRAGEVMAMIGRSLPIVSMSHQYLVTEAVPELVARTEKLPLLRDPDVCYYLRQERSGLLLGPYEWRATPIGWTALPEDFAFKLWNEDLGRLE